MRCKKRVESPLKNLAKFLDFNKGDNVLKVLKIGFIACVILSLLGATLSLLFQHILTGTQPNYPTELKIFVYVMVFVELFILPFIMWKFFRTSLVIFAIIIVFGTLMAFGLERPPAFVRKTFVHFVIFFIVVIIPLIVLTLSVFADKEKILADKRLAAHPYRWAVMIIAEILVIFYVSSYIFYDFGIIFH